MALDTIEEAREEIAKIYIAAFNRVPDAGGLSNWMNQYMAGLMTYEQIAADFANQPEYTAKYPSIMTNSEYITQIYLNVFGRNPDPGGLQNWINQIANPAVSGITRGSVMQEMLKSASVDGNSDGVRLANQAEFAVQSILDGVPTATATAQLANITADAATVTAATAAVAGSAGGVLGSTFTLTTGANTFTGGTSNDTFKAGIDVVINPATGTQTNVDTLQAVDTLVGGTGTDTLNYTTAGTVALGSISEIEVMNVESLAGLTINTSAITDLANLNITKVGTAGAIAATAAGTTDVNVTMAAKGAAVGIVGGNDVNVALTSVDGDTDSVGVDTATDVVTIGTGTAPTGAVTVSMTGAAYTATTATQALSGVNVTGGTTINVTQKATSDSSAVATDTSAATITQGAIALVTNADTTTITVKQDAAVTAKNAAATTGGVTETASVKFGALKANDVLIIGGDGDGTLEAGELQLTATVDMTPAQVAAAFANLVNGEAYGALVVAGDTQSAAAVTKGKYAGSLADWTSASASSDTVVFTYKTANATATDLAQNLTGTGTAPIITTTQGKAHDATIVGGVMGVVAGAVTVDATTSTALKTVTVNGYSATGSAITVAGAAIETLNLSNGGDFTVADTAATLALNLEKVSGAIVLTAAPTTLNVKSIGNNTIGTLIAAATTALNVSGTGVLSAATAATLTATKNITVTETAGLTLVAGATLTALETVNTTGTTGTVTMSIDGTKVAYTGGAGVDNVTVSNAGTAVAKAIDLGAGNDKLTLGGSTVLVPTVELKGGEGTDTLSSDAASLVTLSGATTFAAKLNSFERLEITGATGAQAIDVANLGFASYVTVAGVTNTGAADVLTLNNLANNATVIVNAAVGSVGADGITTVIKDAATGETDVLNFEITNDAGIAAGILTAANIETVNLTVTDVVVDANKDGKDDTDAVHTLTFKADKATALDIGGTAGLTLTLDAATVKLATINASDMTEGGLTVTANGAVAMTITGGSGVDVLTASSGATAKADVLVGGAGNDTLVAGTNGASLTGGLGNDLFVLASTGDLAGTKEANTYSSIKDFQAGDLLKLSFNNDSGGAVHGVADDALGVVGSFTKLAAALNPATASYSDFANAAILEAGVGEAVWFMFGGNSYVVIDSDTNSTSFVNGEDLVIELVGVDLANASFNTTSGTIAL